MLYSTLWPLPEVTGVRPTLQGRFMTNEEPVVDSVAGAEGLEVPDLISRPRRNRKSEAVRSLVREAHLRPDNLIWPLFVIDGSDQKVPIDSMPDCFRYSPDVLVAEAKEAFARGVPAVALFPALPDSLKDKLGSESTNPDGLLQRTVRELKDALPELVVITDVALDPYSSDGHDGILEDGQILNDATLEVLAAMAAAPEARAASIRATGLPSTTPRTPRGSRAPSRAGSRHWGSPSATTRSASSPRRLRGESRSTSGSGSG